MWTFLMLLSCGLALVRVIPTSHASPCKFKADVAFLLDDSKRVGSVNFHKMRNFVRDVVRRFDVRQGAVHIAVGTFSLNGKINFNFDGAYTMKSVLDKTRRVGYRKGRTTWTYLGLKTIREQAFARKGRKGVPKILIVITDGAVKNFNYKHAISEAIKLKITGVTIFTCGVGKTISRPFLKAMASKNQYVFSVSTFARLSLLAKPLFQRTCQAARQQIIQYAVRQRIQNDAPNTTPTEAPTNAPTEAPTNAPTEAPTAAPTEAPTTAPTEAPTTAPTEAPTNAPTEAPTTAPTEAPTTAPTEAPTNAPTEAPTTAPTEAPTNAPTEAETTTTTQAGVTTTEALTTTITTQLPNVTVTTSATTKKKEVILQDDEPVEKIADGGVENQRERIGDSDERVDLIFGIENVGNADMYSQVARFVMSTYRLSDSGARVAVLFGDSGPDVQFGRGPSTEAAITDVIAKAKNVADSNLPGLLRRIAQAAKLSRPDAQKVVILIGHFRFARQDLEKVGEGLAQLIMDSIDVLAFLYDVSPSAGIVQAVSTLGIAAYPFADVADMGCLSKTIFLRLRASYYSWVTRHRIIVQHTFGCKDTVSGREYREDQTWTENCVTFRCRIKGEGRHVSANADVIEIKCIDADGNCHEAGPVKPFSHREKGKLYQQCVCSIPATDGRIKKKYHCASENNVN